MSQCNSWIVTRAEYHPHTYVCLIFFFVFIFRLLSRLHSHMCVCVFAIQESRLKCLSRLSHGSTWYSVFYLFSFHSIFHKCFSTSSLKCLFPFCIIYCLLLLNLHFPKDFPFYSVIVYRVAPFHSFKIKFIVICCAFFLLYCTLYGVIRIVNDFLCG